MFRPIISTKYRRPARRGAILIVVLSLLVLFAIIGITFVYYSDAEATGARIHREGENRSDLNQPDPTDAVNTALGSLLFPVSDTSTAAGLFNALRGHDLMRTMYGWNGIPGQNSVPFNGVGTFHGPTPLPGPNNDRVYWVNYNLANGQVMDPEWSGIPRTFAQINTPPQSMPGNVFIGKNAPYTYADANNFYLGSISPATGEVLVPSFHRQWLFGSLAPNNPNWTSPQGRYMTLRPRPYDQLTPAEIASVPPAQLPTLIAQKIAAGELLPYPPASTDATGNYTYTGDVKNLTGNVGPLQNDSIWLDLGLPPKMWNGRLVKPLVAFLIADHDGRLNANAHHNNRGSYQGFGPWEVSMAPLLGGEANNVLLGRYGPPGQASARTTNTRTMGYDPSGMFTRQLPAYGMVRWDGSGSGLMSLPGYNAATDAPPLTTGPLFNLNGNGFVDNNPLPFPPAQAQNHPGLYNPNEWPSIAGQTRTFSLTDNRRLSLRYADKLEVYQGMDIAAFSPTMLQGSTPPIPNSNYRNDQSHANRLAITMLSAGLDRPGLMANFNPLPPVGMGAGGPYLQYTATWPPAASAMNPNPGPPTTTLLNPQCSLPAPPVTFGTGSGLGDFGANNDWRNLRTGLGPIDLNRPLTPYYIQNTAPNPALAQNVQAWPDRHTLARDIFARLVIATGAHAQVVTTVIAGPPSFVPGDVIVTAPVGSAEYNAVRYLAQLAVNMVDYIDEDDISTPFIFNPIDPNNKMDLVGNLAAAPVGDHVVFGTEKPKLVLNEAYSEVANAPGDPTAGIMPPTNPVHVRFWVELLNPTSTPYNAPASGAQGAGQAQLRFDVPDGVPAPYSVYRMEVYQNGGGAATNLQSANNTVGDATIGPAPGVTPQIRYDFTPAATSPGTARIVAPNNGNYTAGGGSPANGIVIVGPSIGPIPPGGATAPSVNEFNPAPIGGMPPPVAPWINMIQAPMPAGVGPMNAMAYNTIPITTIDAAGAYLQGPALKRHLITLQRLANPYLPPSPTNPYITVDYMDWVPTADAVTRANMAMMNRMPYDPTMAPTGFTPMATRFAVGKVQPYAGFANAILDMTAPPMTPAFPAYLPYPNSMIQRQINAVPVAGQPIHTLGRHNGSGIAAPAAPTVPVAGTESIKTPFDWLPHFDRPVINSLELLELRSSRPSDLTQWFHNGPAGSFPGVVPWATPGHRLYGALDLNRNRPWGYMNALGGRVHGRININTIQDVRVFRGLINEPSGNIAAGTADNLWGNTTTPSYIIGSRTQASAIKTQANGTTQWNVPLPGPTVDDAPPVIGIPGYGAYDRPFKPFGVAEFAAGGTSVYSLGSGIQDTLLRINGATSQPYLAIAGTTTPYQQSETARKILNSTTTVSNVFSVYLTVGYFEVRTDAGGNAMTIDEGGGNQRYLLGKEAYRYTPGDIRQQFFAVMDRSKVGLAPGTNNFFTGQPFFTSVEASALTGSTSIVVAAAGPSVYADGQPVTLTGQTLVIGVGTTAEVRVVTGIGPPGPAGTTTLMLSAPLIYAHGAGESVSNVVPGNPGPQIVDLYNNANSNYRYVVPLLTRTR